MEKGRKSDLFPGTDFPHLFAFVPELLAIAITVGAKRGVVEQYKFFGQFEGTLLAALHHFHGGTATRYDRAQGAV